MDFFVKKRKVLLIVSFCMFLLPSIHLIGAYIYSDGTFRGLPWGSIGIGIVSPQPDPLNPLEYGTWETADLLYHFLFRSLIRYNPASEIYEGDLASCDLSDLKNISCVLREDAVWSDGNPIKSEDVVATFQAFGEKSNNKTLSNLFKSIRIESSGTGAFQISTPENNPLMVNILAYPIIRSDVIDQIKNGRIKKESFITSWPFVYEGSVDDTEYGFHRITLSKNPHYQHTVWLDRLHLKLFESMSAMERAMDTLTVVIPPHGQTMKVSPRFRTVDYTTYEFFSVFFQTDRLDKNIRNILHHSLGHAFHEHFPSEIGHKPMTSIFLDTPPIISDTHSGSMSLEQWLADKWYRPRWMWLKEAHDISTTQTGGVEYPKLRFFTNGWKNAVLYSDDPHPNIRLTGSVPSSTQTVTINNYTLQEYAPGSTSFAYRISQENGTIKEGKNEYHLVLTKQDGSTESETLTIYQSTNPTTLEEFKQAVEAEYLKEKNTEEQIAERQKQKDARIASVEALKDHGYYNADLKPFTLSLAYVESQEAHDAYTSIIVQALSALGIETTLDTLSIKDVESMIKTGKKEYDLLLIGVEAPKNIARIGKTFHSSEAKAGVNFANIESKQLDALFASLRSTTDVGEAKRLQSEIVTFMNDVSFFLPVSSPQHVFYIDRDIKRFSMIPVIPSVSTLSTVLHKVSIKDEYEIQWENKGFFHFFSWLKDNFVTP